MPSEVEGKLVERRFEVDDVIKVGDVVAVIEMEGKGTVDNSTDAIISNGEEEIKEPVAILESGIDLVSETIDDRFYT